MSKEKLHFFHIAVTICMVQLGVDMFRLPYLVAVDFGTNGWIAIIIVSAFVTLNIYLIYLVYRLGKGRSVFQILEGSIPRFILVPFYIGLSALLGLIATLLSLHYILIVKMMSFPVTNPLILNGMLLLLAFLFVSLGIYNMVKASTIFFFFTIWMVLFVFFHFAEFDFVRQTTHLFSEASNYLIGGFRIFVAFSGYEAALFLLPHVQKRTKLFKAVFVGHMITSFIYVGVAFIAFGFFSFGQLKYILAPGIELISYIQLPFVERIENIVFTLFIGEIVVTIGFYYWIAMESLNRVFTKVKPGLILLFIVGSTFLFSIQFETLQEVQTRIAQLDIYYVAIIIALPVLLIVILTLKNKKEKRRKDHAKVG